MYKAKIELLYNIDKNLLIRQVKQYVVNNYTEHQSHLTKRMMVEMIEFLDGFVRCLQVMGEEPMRDQEVQQLIFDESILYIKRKLNLES